MLLLLLFGVRRDTGFAVSICASLTPVAAVSSTSPKPPAAVRDLRHRRARVRVPKPAVAWLTQLARVAFLFVDPSTIPAAVLDSLRRSGPVPCFVLASVKTLVENPRPMASPATHSARAASCAFSSSAIRCHLPHHCLLVVRSSKFSLWSPLSAFPGARRSRRRLGACNSARSTLFAPTAVGVPLGLPPRASVLSRQLAICVVHAHLHARQAAVEIGQQAPRRRKLAAARRRRRCRSCLPALGGWSRH